MMARAACLLAIAAALYWFTPLEIPLCGFRWLTGLPCPLCGLTRAMFLLAKGEWMEAVRLHALSPLVAAALAGLVMAGQRRMGWALRPLTILILLYGLGRIAGLTVTL